MNSQNTKKLILLTGNTALEQMFYVKPSLSLSLGSKQFITTFFPTKEEEIRLK